MDENHNRMPLPTEVMWGIFKNCDVQTLGRLTRSCKTFQNMINLDSMWKEKCVGVLASNCENEEIFQKTRPVLNCKDKCRISSRWRKNIFQKKLLIKCRKLMILNLELEGEALYCSNGRNLHRYDRAVGGSIIPKVTKVARTETSDLAHFVISGEEIISGSREGTIYRHNKRTLKKIASYDIHPPHPDNSINCVDAGLDMIVCGSRDANIRVFRTDERIINHVCDIYTGTRVLSVAIMPFTRTLVAGLPAVHSIHPLQLYDLQTRQFLGSFGEYVKGAGILSIKPESEHTFLVGGYDTTIRLWDIRTPQKCVSMWMEPFDNSIYCVKSDNNMTIISGACRHALMHLWDKRCWRPVQLHFVEGYRGSVHSIVFDGCRKIVALDNAVLEFDYNV